MSQLLPSASDDPRVIEMMAALAKPRPTDYALRLQRFEEWARANLPLEEDDDTEPPRPSNVGHTRSSVDKGNRARLKDAFETANPPS
jgi:hypothetical protein